MTAEVPRPEPGGGPVLVPPTTAVHASFLAAQIELADRDEDLANVPDLRLLATPSGFRAYVATLLGQAREDGERRPGLVPATHLWYVDRGEYLGRLTIRHRLTELLLRLGGHIGYEVRPSARRRGHATRMLGLGLPVAARLGIDPALITCDLGNEASRRVIEHHGGRPDVPIGGKLRYWVATTGSVS